MLVTCFYPLKSSAKHSKMVSLSKIEFKTNKRLTAAAEGLNHQQKRALVQMADYLAEPKTGDMFLLKGYAGTGKTFTIGRLIEYFAAKKRDARIAITAPTNKAVQELAKSAPKEIPGTTYRTIHSLLGLKEVIKESGHIDFEADFNAPRDEIRRCDLVIIDEVSMLDDKLFFEINPKSKSS